MIGVIMPFSRCRVNAGLWSSLVRMRRLMKRWLEWTALSASLQTICSSKRRPWGAAISSIGCGCACLFGVVTYAEHNRQDIGNELYQIEVPSHCRRIPPDYDLRSSTKAVGRYWTPAIREWTSELAEAKLRLSTVNSSFFERLQERFDGHASTWLSAAQCLGELDCLVSLAVASRSLTEPSCRPEIVDCPR
jgi:hypothetical protein